MEADVDDVDWDGLAVAVPRRHGRLQLQLAQPAPGPGPAHHHAVEAVEAHAAPAVPRVRWQVRIPAPGRRSREQHVLAAARMRENRARQIQAPDLILSYIILSYIILSYLILSYLILPYLMFIPGAGRS